ncbi:MAG: hypothetical protein IT207_01320 [Fimbriimonadaceae bacterium]|nr:hypothetical protein [Fimbriimonadaceae bacterium]
MLGECIVAEEGMRKLLLSVLAIGLVGFASAQAPETTPPKELEELNWLLGKWKGTGSFSFGGMDLTVTSTMAVTWDGQFLKSVSTNDYGAFQSTETLFLGWDATKSQYFIYAFTNFSPMPRRETGTKQGDSVVMTSDPWDIMGQTMVSRGTMTKVDGSKIKFKLEFKAGDAWELAADMELKKE